jgi:drug/metabolite transporter (DMT)-like permease
VGIVPLLGLRRGHRAGLWVWIGCVLAIGGLYLLSIHGSLAISLGDTLVLGSAFGWAIHVHVVGWLAERMSPVFVAAGQFAICAMLSLAVATAVEPIRLSAILDATWAIAYAGILSVGVAYTLQVVGQRRIDPARAGIILSLESVFAVIGGWLLLGEVLSVRGALGCSLMLAGMIVAQIRSREGISDAFRSPANR